MTQQTKPSAPSPAKLITAAVAALVAAYIFASLAFDRGSWGYYALTLVSFYFAIRYFLRGLKAKKSHE